MFKTEPTYSVQVFMAGDVADAKRALRRVCYNEGLCVTVTQTHFIYTGGEEAGIVVGFVNYPRFPATAEEVHGRALRIAETLVRELNQKSALVVAPDVTTWMTIEPPGAP